MWKLRLKFACWILLFFIVVALFLIVAIPYGLGLLLWKAGNYTNNEAGRIYIKICTLQEGIDKAYRECGY